MNLLALTPPAVIAMPKEFNENYHEGICLKDLVYSRPVLFYERLGIVAVQGQVKGQVVNQCMQLWHDSRRLSYCIHVADSSGEEPKVETVADLKSCEYAIN